MITIKISGPKDAVQKAASQVATLYQTGGKIVRTYTHEAAETALDHKGIPICDVLIITEMKDAKRT